MFSMKSAHLFRLRAKFQHITPILICLGTNDSPDILSKDVGISLFLVDTDKLFVGLWIPKLLSAGIEPATLSS